jgi:pyruvate dehydrogenase E2 component (dihydrolipoamide acetyltransferase)
MPIDVTMPKLSDNMEAGTIVRWLKKPGQEVKRGEPLAEVETDKADVEVEASDGGTLIELRVQEGESAPVGAVIAVLGAPDEAIAEIEAATGKGEGAREGALRVEQRPENQPPPASARQEATRSRASSPPGRAATAEPKPVADVSVRRGPPQASPLAKRLADEAGIDLAMVAGTGPGGRIVKRDVEARLTTAPTPASEQTIPNRREPESPAAPAPRVEAPSRMRLTIARRMTEAKRDIPHFYVRADVDMGECMRLRESLKTTEFIPYLTVTHLVVKAAAVTLRRHPRVNASWQEDGSIEIHEAVNPGIAVAIEDGLIVPVLHHAERMTLAEVAAGVRTLTDKARSGKFSGQDLAGSTISISNVGMLDVDELIAVINPPHAAVLAVAAVKERPVVRNGRIEAARTMCITLSCDHRVLNGVEGAGFLQDLKRLIEDPVRLLVE